MLKAIDWFLFLPAGLLSLLGLLVIFSVVPEELGHQAFFLLIALGLFLVFAKLDVSILSSFAPLAYGLMVMTLLLTYVFGVVSHGSLRWLDLGFFRFQPSELAKPCLSLALALYASRSDFKRFRPFLIFALLLMLPAILIFRQPDLGSALVIITLGGAILLAKGIRARWLLTFILVVVVFLPLFWSLLKPYQKDRVLAFVNPQADPLGASYHQIQATIAVGSGQIFGKGLGSGSQAHLKFLPERQTDFIFATFAEEFGFLGSLVLLILYGVLFQRLLFLAQQAENEFSRLVLVGIFAFLWFQTTTHIAMNINLLPITGVTLPFLSVGGSSLLSSWLALGIATSLAKSAPKQQALEIK